MPGRDGSVILKGPAGSGGLAAHPPFVNLLLQVFGTKCPNLKVHATGLRGRERAGLRAGTANAITSYPPFLPQEPPLWYPLPPVP